MKGSVLALGVMILSSSKGWSLFNFRELDFWMVKDPASLVESKKMEMTSTYSQIYALRELSALGVGVHFPNRLGHSSICTTQLGNSFYQESELIFSHGFNLKENLSLGFNLKGLFLKIQDFGEDSSFQFDGSLKIPLNSNLSFAATLWNLSRSSLAGGRQSLPAGLLSEIRLNYSKLKFTLEITRIDPDPFYLKTTASFPIHSTISLEGGFRDRPALFFGGLKFHLPKVSLDYIYRQNRALPGYHQFILTWELKS